MGVNSDLKEFKDVAIPYLKETAEQIIVITSAIEDLRKRVNELEDLNKSKEYLNKAKEFVYYDKQ